MGQLRFLRTGGEKRGGGGGEREPVDGVVRREEENAKGVIVAMEEIVVVVVVVEGLTLQTSVISPVSSSMASAAVHPLFERSSATAWETDSALQASDSLKSG